CIGRWWWGTPSATGYRGERSRRHTGSVAWRDQAWEPGPTRWPARSQRSGRRRVAYAEQTSARRRQAPRAVGYIGAIQSEQESNQMQNRIRYWLAAGSLLALAATSIRGVGADAAVAKPAKVGKIIFDTAVTPHWMDSGDRFWYSFENSSGRKFYMVDPAKKTRSMVFDPAKLAASLAAGSGLPYDSQPLPSTAIRFVKNEGSIQCEVNVPRDAVIPGEKKTSGAAAATDNAANQQQEDAEDAGDQPQQQLGGRGGGNFAPAPGRNQKQLAFEY